MFCIKYVRKSRLVSTVQQRPSGFKLPEMTLIKSSHFISFINIDEGKKLQNLDDKQMADIAAELEGESSDPKDDQKTKAEKKKFAVQQRLAAERKKESKKSTKSKKAQAADDDDDDEDALLTFAKGTRTDKKKN